MLGFVLYIPWFCPVHSLVFVLYIPWYLSCTFLGFCPVHSLVFVLSIPWFCPAHPFVLYIPCSSVSSGCKRVTQKKLTAERDQVCGKRNSLCVDEESIKHTPASGDIELLTYFDPAFNKKINVDIPFVYDHFGY